MTSLKYGEIPGGDKRMGKKENTLTAIGLAIGAIGLIAQLTAPKCPVCNTKLLIINNYCINCRISYNPSLSKV